MQQPAEFHRLFYTPIWRYVYPDFQEDRKHLIEYFSNDDLYITEREKNGLQITRANLHKDKSISKLVGWIQECCESTMVQMGLVPKCGITSMWATRHRAGGFHHSHHHANSFIGGVMHLFDLDGCASGTIFNNTDNSKYVICPAELKNSTPMLKYDEHMPFIPGTLLLFPAWAEHTTAQTESRYRIVAAINCMPIGMTNNDHYDRYNYSDLIDMELKNYG